MSDRSRSIIAQGRILIRRSREELLALTLDLEDFHRVVGTDIRDARRPSEELAIVKSDLERASQQLREALCLLATIDQLEAHFPETSATKRVDLAEVRAQFAAVREYYRSG